MKVKRNIEVEAVFRGPWMADRKVVKNQQKPACPTSRPTKQAA